MSWWTMEDSFVLGSKQGNPAALRGTPWCSLRRLFDPERGDRDVLALFVTREDGVASLHAHKVELCDGTGALIRLVRDAVKRDAQSLWRDPATEARFWTAWYRLMTGMPPEDVPSCIEGIAALARQVAGDSAYGDQLLRLCDTRFSKKNFEAISRLEGALLAGEKEDIKIYGYVCLKLWTRYEDMFSKWLRCQFVMKALRRPRDPNHARVLHSDARFRSTSGRLADLVAYINRTGHSAVIDTHYDKASSMPNPLLPTEPSSIAGRDSAMEICYCDDPALATWWKSMLCRGVQMKGDGTYQLVAVQVISKVPPGPDLSSQLNAWFRDEYVRKVLLGATDKKKAVFPNLGVFELRPNRLISVSPWARHGNIKQYVFVRVKDIPPGDSKVHDIVLDLMEQLLPAVDGVHKANLVHGNLKGNNVLITDNAVLRLADFGSYDVSSAPYCATNRSSIPWHKRMVEKSGVFMSPELRRSGIPTKESDMWAVSCVFLELYLAALNASTQHGHILVAEDLRKPHPGIPHNIWRLIRANWVDPGLRPSAADMHQQLNQIRDVMQAGISN